MRTLFRTHDAPPLPEDNHSPDTAPNGVSQNGNGAHREWPAEEAPRGKQADRSGLRGKDLGRKTFLGLPRPSLEPYYRTITLSVEKDVARVVVFRGRKITAWGSTPLEAITQPGDDPENPASSPLSNLLDQLGIRYGGRWRELLDQLGIRAGRVVMDFTLYTTLMRFLQVPRVRGRYFEPVVVSEVLEAIPFDQEEVDIAWHALSGNEDRSVFAVALPKARVDRQVRLLKEGGLIPAAAYSKASVLALAAGTPNGIVVHLETTQAAIVLVKDGAPQVVHQLEFAEQGSRPEDQCDAIARAIDQVAGYDQNFDLGYRGDRLPIVFTGKNSASDSPVAQLLRQNLPWEVHPFAPPIQHPADFPLEEYATNMGLYLADRVEARRTREESTPSVPALDLLPLRHQPKPLPVFQAAIFITLLLLAVHPFDFTQLVHDKQVEAQSISRELRDLRSQQQRFNLVLARHQENETGFKSAEAQGLALSALQEKLDEDMSLLLSRLRVITDEARPEDVSLTTITPLSSDWSVRGSAPTYDDALKYAAALKAYPIFEDARAVQVQGSEASVEGRGEGVVSFVVKVVLPHEEETKAKS